MWETPQSNISEHGTFNVFLHAGRKWNVSSHICVFKYDQWVRKWTRLREIPNIPHKQIDFYEQSTFCASAQSILLF